MGRFTFLRNRPL